MVGKEYVFIHKEGEYASHDWEHHQCFFNVCQDAYTKYPFFCPPPLFSELTLSIITINGHDSTTGSSS